MNSNAFVSLVLGLVIFSFALTATLIVPFINILYKLNFTRRKEAPRKGKIPLFDKLHDIKAGTPVGGGILMVPIVSVIFLLIFPFASRMGVLIRSSFDFRMEVFVILFTFLSFGFLGLLDDLVKLFGKPKQGQLGMWIGIGRRTKFILQCVFATISGYILHRELGIGIVHVPLFDFTINLGALYIPFAAFVIVAFSNAFNITDGLDGLSSGLLVICLIAFGGLAAGGLDTPLAVFIGIWIGALIAFLYFNVWPARIILGDAGALSFGATLGLIGLLTGSIVGMVFIGGIFVIEIASSAIQILGWKILKRPIFPLAPLHHSFLAVGWEEPKIVMRAWLAGIILAIFGLWLANI